MRTNEGLPLVKLMMLLSSMTPLFVLVGIKGMDIVISDKRLWVIIALLIFSPFLILIVRIRSAKKSRDIFILNVTATKDNKEYLFTYLFTVLLPLYSVSVTSKREIVAVIAAIAIILFVLWNMNLHYINMLFALKGYKVYTIESSNSAILLTDRTNISSRITELKVHRLSNTVFIELKNFNYDNR